MNKQIVLSIALCTASSTAFAAGTFETWNGADENAEQHIQTGLGNTTQTEGYWYSFGDDWYYHGESKVVYPLDPCLDYPYCYSEFYDELFNYCKGYCGTASLNRGSATITPFAGVGFNVVGETSTTNTTPAAGDASAWGGLCVTYISNVDIQLELGLGDAIDTTMNYALPAVTLPAAKASNILSPNGKDGNKVVVSWSDFKQPSWYDGAVKFDGETAAKQLVGVHFKIQAEPGDYEFNICAVGPKDGSCPEKCGISSAGIKVARGTSAVKAILNGRMLGFSGIKTSATVEVMNSLGQVVMKGAINNATTLNLAALKAGIYMVRVNGKNVNFAKKIVLR
ncbi:T9SS type A sorting domain-containing protein [Fibrobacter succinogenes]|uniref:T9SS type A sorting domain-containing protein n=1 Tax=Fibrobacter succinogenes TaxID=833 RepID=UPI001568BDC1|nr:T9SS type A sorting domain-containing protein [Fibrobacter succinogenes]